MFGEERRNEGEMDKAGRERWEKGRKRGKLM